MIDKTSPRFGASDAASFIFHRAHEFSAEWRERIVVTVAVALGLAIVAAVALLMGRV